VHPLAEPGPGSVLAEVSHPGEPGAVIGPVRTPAAERSRGPPICACPPPLPYLAPQFHETRDLPTAPQI